MIYLKIMDEKNEQVWIEDLTETGKIEAIYECKQLLEELENLDPEE